MSNTCAFKYTNYLVTWSLFLSFSYMVKNSFKPQRYKFTQGKTWDGWALISIKTPFKNMRASVLCFAFLTSNQIPFALCTCPLSPECVFRAVQTCHNEDTVKCFTQGEISFFFVKSFAFLLLPVMADSGLIKTPSYLFVCFSPMSAFPGKQATTHV